MYKCSKYKKECDYATSYGACTNNSNYECPKTYCYARVSTKEQKLDRQIEAFKPYEPYELYCDKESGKDFDRKQYQIMREKLEEGDTLIILSLDRLGKNYDLIKQEWSYFVNKGIKIKVLDMPIINTTSNDLTSKLISDIVIQLLSYVAEVERNNIKKRQAQGIKVAKDKGVHCGRPKYKLPDNFEEIAKKYQDYELTREQCLKLLNMTKGTFLKYLVKLGYSRKELRCITNKH